MKVELTNVWAIIPDSDDLTTNAIRSSLTFTTPERRIWVKGRKVTMYETVERLFHCKDGRIYIPVGLYPLLFEGQDVEIVDKRYVIPKLLETKEVTDCIEDYSGILKGIMLTTEQLIAVRKILYAKRGIINIGTGGGKTEIMCATVALLTKIYGSTPTTVILEPTIKLVKDTIARFKKYDIEAIPYSECRKVQEGVVTVAHPKSMLNDLKKNSEIFGNVLVLLVDEAHHINSEMYREVIESMTCLQYSIGVSASAISYEHRLCRALNEFSVQELKVIGATGRLLMSLTAEYLIDKGTLATPLLVRMDNPANEDISRPDWQEVVNERLHSESRNMLIAKSAKIFSMFGRRTLILVNTVGWAQELLKIFNDLGISDKVFASYGSGKFETYGNGIGKDRGYFERFEEGSYNIAIGTTHLYEGADIKALDTIILGFGGKAERLQVQGVGRALRKSKTGKYAYIVDFTDDKDRFLSKQSNLRRERYTSIIGIPDSDVYDSSKLSDLYQVLLSREENLAKTS